MLEGSSPYVLVGKSVYPALFGRVGLVTEKQFQRVLFSVCRREVQSCSLVLHTLSVVITVSIHHNGNFELNFTLLLSLHSSCLNRPTEDGLKAKYF